MRLKSIFTLCGREKKARLFRVIWERGEGPGLGLGRGHSAMISISLCPKLFSWTRGLDDWRVTLMGISVHYARSYGGRFV